MDIEDSNSSTRGDGPLIIDRFSTDEGSASHLVHVFHPGGGLGVELPMEVQCEHVMDVYVNEVPTFRVTCSPDHLVELVMGRLLTEGVIESLSDVEEAYLCEYATRARVMLRNIKADFARSHIESIPTCCTGNRTLNGYFASDRVPDRLEPIRWDSGQIFDLAERFARDTPMHRKTLGTHSCYLAHGSEVLYSREDLGRHNAFDKAVGAALLDGVNLSDLIAFTSGRVPVDMVQKAIRARIPVLVTKAVPTDATIGLARDFGLTLICQARPDSFKVCHDPTKATSLSSPDAASRLC